LAAIICLPGSSGNRKRSAVARIDSAGDIVLKTCRTPRVAIYSISVGAATHAARSMRLPAQIVDFGWHMSNSSYTRAQKPEDSQRLAPPALVA